MIDSKTAAFLGVLIVAALATGTVLYVQGEEDARGADAHAASAAAQVVPEAAFVHEGPREPIQTDAGQPIPVKVYASPTCSCCSAWMEHLGENGFEVEVEYRSDMGAVKESLGLPSGLDSCHTGVVGDYVVEGHVPADDLRRFLAEAPSVRGLTVPGMPVGSPGMEVPTGEVDSYEVLTFTADGETEVFARHGPGSSGG